MNFVEFLEQHYGQRPQLSDRYGEGLGYEIIAVDKDRLEVVSKLIVREDHLSPSGAVHGGVISGFLDFSCGCAAISSLGVGEMCSTVELNVKYFKPLREGDEIRARSKVVHRGKTLCSAISEVFCGELDSDPVALATGTFNIYRPKRKG